MGKGIQMAFRFSLSAILAFSLIGCGSDEESDNIGFIRFYNAAADAPKIFLTIDENLESSDSDEVEITFSGVAFGGATSLKELTPQNYVFELAWQDDDSTERSELALIHQESIAVKSEQMHFIVLSDSVQSPTVSVYNLDLIEDEDDVTYNRFNFSLLNLTSNNLDIYVSESNETFNQAQLLTSFSQEEMSENIKLEQGSFVFYITYAGENDILFQSDSIDFFYASQSIIAVKKNTGAGASPFVIDKISSSNITSYADLEAEARVSFYNGITLNDLMPDYTGDIKTSISGINNQSTEDLLALGELSSSHQFDHGDYSLTVQVGNESLLKNHLISLPQNGAKTVFLYADEKYVDHDNDGNVDENNDGIVDETEITIHSLVADNRSVNSLYEHEIKVVNLIDDTDFVDVTAYFVRSDETIDTAQNKRTAGFNEVKAITLRNNSYRVYIIARENSSNIILTSFELTLDEASNNQFLVLETDIYAPSGFKATLLTQTVND